jgi:hypothetical protein
VFREKLTGVLDAPLPFLWNIKSDDRVSPSVSAFLRRPESISGERDRSPVAQ